MSRPARMEFDGGGDWRFAPEFFVRLRRFSLRLRRPSAAQYHGVHRASSSGGSLEFGDRRSYEPGDDPRHVDWLAHARTGRLFTKLFAAERGTRISLLIDVSASMATPVPWAHPCKLDFARWIAAAIGTIALVHGDGLRLGFFSDTLLFHRQLPPGQRSLRGLYSAMATPVAPGGRTDLHASLDEFVRRGGHPGPAILIGDFCWVSEPVSTSRLLRSAKFQPHFLRISDPPPCDLPPGTIVLEDAEGGGRREIEWGESAAACYSDAALAHEREFVVGCRAAGVPFAMAEAGEAWEAACLRALAAFGLLR